MCVHLLYGTVCNLFVKKLSRDKGFGAAAAAAASTAMRLRRCHDHSDRFIKESAGTRVYTCVIMFVVGASILSLGHGE